MRSQVHFISRKLLVLKVVVIEVAVDVAASSKLQSNSQSGAVQAIELAHQLRPQWGARPCVGEQSAEGQAVVDVDLRMVREALAPEYGLLEWSQRHPVTNFPAGNCKVHAAVSGLHVAQVLV